MIDPGEFLHCRVDAGGQLVPVYRGDYAPASALGGAREELYVDRLAVIAACPHRGAILCACSGEVECRAMKGPRWRPGVARPTDCHRCADSGLPPA